MRPSKSIVFSIGLIVLTIGFVIAIGVFFVPFGFVDYRVPLHITAIVTDATTVAGLETAELRFINLENDEARSFAALDNAGYIAATIDVRWGSIMSLASLVFPRYPTVRLEVVQKGYLSYEQTFQLSRGLKKDDTWRIDLGQVTLRPLADPKSN